jgi:hypothetical protein
MPWESLGALWIAKATCATLAFPSTQRSVKATLRARSKHVVYLSCPLHLIAMQVD